VTMAMQYLQVGVRGGASLLLRLDVVDFQPVGIAKEQGTGRTAPVLSLQEEGKTAPHQRVVTQPLTPVDEIAVKGASRAASLHMAANGCSLVLGEDEAHW